MGMPPVISFPQSRASMAAAGLAPTVVRTQTVLPSLGTPTPLHLSYAEELRNSLPEAVRSAAREPRTAVALIYAMLLSQDAVMCEQQVAQLGRQTTQMIYETTVALVPVVQPVARRMRLPLVELAMPALRSLRPDEFQQFTRTLKWLIESDRQIDLFEFVLHKIIRRHLEPRFTQTRPPARSSHT